MWAFGAKRGKFTLSAGDEKNMSGEDLSAAVLQEMA